MILIFCFIQLFKKYCDLLKLYEDTLVRYLNFKQVSVDFDWGDRKVELIFRLLRLDLYQSIKTSPAAEAAVKKIWGAEMLVFCFLKVEKCLRVMFIRKFHRCHQGSDCET